MFIWNAARNPNILVYNKILFLFLNKPSIACFLNQYSGSASVIIV